MLTSEASNLIGNKLRLVILHLEIGDTNEAKACLHDASALVKSLTIEGDTCVVGVGPLKEVISRYELDALDKCEGNIERAAKLLGIGKTTLYHHMRLLGRGSTARRDLPRIA
jgi:transcriptional regulator of acetoin/glycerol metabolism